MSHPSKPGASGKSQLVRPRFSPGLLLQDDDLTASVDYASELSRLMFRSLFGCGVVCGLKVTLHNKNNCKATITVAPGLALNGCGDPVQLTAAQTIALDQVNGKLWVVISRSVTQCQRRETACSVDEDAGDSVTTRLHDGFQISLYSGAEAPDGACGCAPLKARERADDPATEHAKGYQQHAAGLCACDCHSELVVLGMFADLEASLAAAADVDAGVDADHSVR
ncbi:MAG: hypothetical protein ABIT83_18660, partial [Massilia sp.]